MSRRSVPLPLPVVVLGSRLIDGVPDALLRARLDRALEVADNGALFVVTGFGEAHAMRDYLVSHGVPRRRVIVESEATSTNENLENVHRLLAEKHVPGDTGDKSPWWYVVTNDFHVRRTRLWAWHLGHHVRVVAAPTPWPDKPRNYFRELVALPHSALRIAWRRWRAAR
ncbi:YdcF family protein [Corynebacterium incognita]|uniref:YdcF family protein n=1 Tax=Corynebacterium incognita TaxID=2754725 RepID=UPI001FE543A7|nr:YdcF family protein [Corynebacterium incognita]